MNPAIEENANRLVRRLGPQAKRFDFDHEAFSVVVAGQVATIIGHGDGLMIGNATPERVANLLHEKSLLVGVEMLFLDCCWSGLVWVGKRLHELLGIEVWAPITPVAFSKAGVLRAWDKDPKDPKKWRPTDPRDV